MDDRDPLQDAEIGLSRGGATVPTYRPPAPLPGGVLDRDVADVVRVPPGSQLPGDELRSGVRSVGVAAGLPDRAQATAPRTAADPPRDGPHGGATGRLREPEAQGRAGPANGMAGPATT